MSERLTRAEQVQRNRELVLEAARRVFLDRGYGGATVEAIAEEAGFSKGVVYSQFASKGDLFLGLLEQRIAERGQENKRLAAAVSAEEPEGILPLLRAVAHRSADDADWGRLLIEFRVVAARDEALNRRYAELHAKTVDGFARVLEQVSDVLGEPLTHDARALAEFILATDVGLTLERAVAPDALPQTLLDDLFTRVLGLRARDAATTM